MIQTAPPALWLSMSFIIDVTSRGLKLGTTVTTSSADVISWSYSTPSPENYKYKIKALRDLPENFKALKNKFKTVKYCYFFLDSQLNRLIQNEQNTVLSKHFTKPAEYTRYNQWKYFQRGCMD